MIFFPENQLGLDFNQINQYPNVIINGSLNASDPLQSGGYPSDGFAQVDGVNGSLPQQQPGLTGQLPYGQGTGQFGVGGVDPNQQQYPGDMGQQPLQPGFVAGGDMGAIQQPAAVAGGDVGAIQQPGLPPSGDNLQQQVDLNSLQIPAETQQALGIQGDGASAVVGGDNALNDLPQPPNAPLAELRNPAMADPNYGELNSTASEGFDYGTNEDDDNKDSSEITGEGQAFNVVDRVNREAPSGEGFNDAGTALNMVPAATSNIAPPTGVEGEAPAAGTSDIVPPTGVEGEAAPAAVDDGSNPLKQMMEKWISTNEGITTERNRLSLCSHLV